MTTDDTPATADDVPVTADLDGAPPATVRRALRERDPLPGAAGFAGALDGALVRDVLGRRPLFSGGEQWAFEPGALDDPTLLPPGTVRVQGETRRVWELPDSAPASDPRAAVERLQDALGETLDAIDASGLAVAFSGGVDSALLAAATGAPCYVAGFEGSRDREHAREAAAALGVDLREVALTHDDLRAAVPRVVAATGRTGAMDVSIALPLLLVAERAADAGFDRLALGQGADELFGGYQKVARAPDDHRVDADAVRGARDEVLQSLPDQLPRDVCAVRAAGVEPVLPLLHDRVVAAAIDLPGSLLVDGRGTRKVAFRLAARAWLPHAVAFREKTAVQYGSLVSRELDRLARRAGFKRRLDDHVGKYVDSLVS